MQLLGLAQQQHIDTLLQRLMAQQQQHSRENSNARDGNGTNFSLMAKPRWEG
jgi:hypothetical protein